MRLRTRLNAKLLSFLLIFGIICVVSINYLVQNVKSDEFLTHLPAAVESTNDWNIQIPTLNNLLNLSNFAYILPNESCKNRTKELLAIIIVTSYVGHDELRAAHRQAIAQQKLLEMGFQRIFLLAQIPAQERFITQQQLANEQLRFGDLLQGNFLEAYHNLSYKHIMGLRWAATECRIAKFIVKVDDDIVFDIFQLRRYLEFLEVQQTKLATSAALLAGYVLDAKPVVRNQANKWFVSEQEYKPHNYPAYLSGWLYITNAKTALRLVAAAQDTPIFWIDDTWVTGIVRARLNISMQMLNSWYSANSGFMECCVRDLKLHNYECDYYVGPNGGDNKLLVEFLHNVEKCYFDECSRRAPDKTLKATCVASAKHIVPAHGEAHVKMLRL